MKYISYYSVLDYFALALRFMALVVTNGKRDVASKRDVVPPRAPG